MVWLRTRIETHGGIIRWNALDETHPTFELAQVPAVIESYAVARIAAALTAALAALFALYLKTRNFRWHVSGPHFRDRHLLLDEQSEQIFAMTAAMAERVRKIGGTTPYSIGHIARLQRVADNDLEFDTHTQYATSRAMLLLRV